MRAVTRKRERRRAHSRGGRHNRRCGRSAQGHSALKPVSVCGLVQVCSRAVCRLRPRLRSAPAPARLRSAPPSGLRSCGLRPRPPVCCLRPPPGLRSAPAPLRSAPRPARPHAPLRSAPRPRAGPPARVPPAQPRPPPALRCDLRAPLPPPSLPPPSPRSLGPGPGGPGVFVWSRSFDECQNHIIPFGR